MSPPDFWNLIAERKRGMPVGWGWFSIKLVDSSTGAALLKGAVCTAVFQRGPQKGQKNWSKRDRSTERELVITEAELAAMRLEWEAETGRCFVCGGSGQQFASWSATAGTKTEPCTRCRSTGRAPGQPAQLQVAPPAPPVQPERGQLEMFKAPPGGEG